MKSNFDKDAKIRVFEEGDKVLAFIPVPRSPVQEKHHEPYNTLGKVGNNYIISTHYHRKSTQLLHVHLLKLYKSKIPVPVS